MKRFISLLLSLVVTITMTTFVFAPVNALPQTGEVIYVMSDGKGNGETPESPMGSISTAVSNLQKLGGGTVVLVGPVYISGNITLGGGAFGTPVKITSSYGNTNYGNDNYAGIVFKKQWSTISLKSEIIFDDIYIYSNASYCFFYANGYPLTMGRGVRVILDPGFDKNDFRNYPGIFGGSSQDLGSNSNFPANTSLTILSGTYSQIYAGGNGTAEKPRPANDASLSLGSDVKVLEHNAKKSGWYSKGVGCEIDGEKVLIFNGEKNTDINIPSDVKCVITSSGNGYVQGVSMGNVNLWADSGYGAKIGDNIYPNGSYSFTGDELNVIFVQSDVNKMSELDAKSPKLPNVFPGVYIKGYDNGNGTFSFKPAGNITIGEVATIITRLITDEESIKGQYTTEKAKAEDWFYHNVAYLDSFGYFNAFENFDGTRAITRAEFVNLISRVKRLIARSNEIKFSDVSENYKYYNDIKLATTSKIVNGYDNGDGSFSFRPENPITRAEVVTVINRVFDIADLAPLNYKGLIPAFTDVKEEHWASFQIVAAAGGKEKPRTDIYGTGIVEYKVDGPVIYTRDGAPATNDGLTPDTAVSYGKALGYTHNGGTIVVCGPVTFSGNGYFTDDNTDKTVLITSVYDGVDYRVKEGASLVFNGDWKACIPGGDLIIDNIAIVSKGRFNSIYADNHKVIFGKDVVCVTDGEKAEHLTLYAGAAAGLGASRNYIGNTAATLANRGVYVGNLEVHGGSWTLVTGGGTGNEQNPRENYATVVTVGENASPLSINAGSKEGFAKVRGKRVLILDNFGTTISNADYDFVVAISGKASADVISISEQNVTLKISTDDGGSIQGLSADGTYVIDKDGVLMVDATTDVASAAYIEKSDTVLQISPSVEYVSDAYFAELDQKETEMKNAIINSKTTGIAPADGKTAYYVSADGNDENDGKSPETAWKSIDKVNRTAMYAGDVVFFRRGDIWRNVLLATKAGVTYSAYGEGAKPILTRSPFDGAKHGSWSLVEGYNNIYVYSEPFVYDVGQLVFNEGTFTDIYANKLCFDYNSDKLPVDSAGAVVENAMKYLEGDLWFWHDLGGPVNKNDAGGLLYVRSDSGNPAQRFDNIEFSQASTTITLGLNNVTIDNLDIRYSGSHAIGGSNSTVTFKNILIQNCTLYWIGGSIQGYSGNKNYVRLGNGVEIFGGVDTYSVNSCYIDQIFDAAVTHQITDSYTNDFVMNNITYSNNLILNAVYSIEHFMRNVTGSKRSLTNILYKNNICRYAGYGFGQTRPDKSAPAHIRSGGLVSLTANFVIEGNVFDRSTYDMFKLQTGGDEEIQWRNNTYIQKAGASYGLVKNKPVEYTPSAIKGSVASSFKSAEIGGNYLYTK